MERAEHTLAVGDRAVTLVYDASQEKLLPRAIDFLTAMHSATTTDPITGGRRLVVLLDRKPDFEPLSSGTFLALVPYVGTSVDLVALCNIGSRHTPQLAQDIGQWTLRGTIERDLVRYMRSEAGSYVTITTYATRDAFLGPERTRYTELTRA